MRLKPLLIGILLLAPLLLYSEAKKIIYDPNVFICDNDKAKVYHMKKTCSPMKKCKHRVVAIKRSKALRKGLRPSKSSSCNAW